MSNNNGFDLFSYFDGGFSEPSEPKADDTQVPQAEKPATVAAVPSETAASTEAATVAPCDPQSADAAPGDTNVVHFAARRLREQRQAAKPEDACEDACGGEGEPVERDDELNDEEREALADEVDPDESSADKAELAGKAANSEVKADQKSAVTAGAAVAKKEEIKPAFNQATYIAYAGNSFLLSKFFDADKLAELDLEAVRKRLEKDFPELSKQRTKMEWDEKKNLIIPMVTGGKKGAFFTQGVKGFFFRSKDLFANKEMINILAARDGYYEVRENAIGVFVAKAEVIEDLESCREGFKLSLPKIPTDLFAQLVSFFADYAARDEEVEVMGVFYWDTENKRYVLDVPVQEVSKVKVNASYSDFPLHFIKVAEIHSHNTMGAYFSDVDDADELGTMLYGVVGRLRRGLREISYALRTRAGVAGRFIPLDPCFIIEGDFSEHMIQMLEPVEYPMHWHERVRIAKSRKSGEVI